MLIVWELMLPFVRALINDLKMEQKLKNLDTVLDTVKDCVESCGEIPGLAVFMLTCLPDNDLEKNTGVMCGLPENLITTLLKGMVKHSTIRDIILTAAASYRVFNKVAGNAIRNEK